MAPELVELSVTKVVGADGERVRVDVRQGQSLICRLDMTLEEYARVQFGEACVPVTMTAGRSR